MEVRKVRDPEALELHRQARERATERLEPHPARLEVPPGEACGGSSESEPAEHRPKTRRVWRNLARRRGAMAVARQGRRESLSWITTGATEAAASGRTAARR